jgi:hypothetical protein
LVRLNRKEIGDDDARLIANILISLLKGQILMDDLGCYAREHHEALIREGRLMAGVYTLRNFLKSSETALLMPKVGKRCIKDAEVLAQ